MQGILKMTNSGEQQLGPPSMYFCESLQLNPKNAVGNSGILQHLKSCYLGSDMNAQVDLVDKRKQQLKDQQKIHATVLIQQSPEAKDLSSKQPLEILQPNPKNAVGNSGILQHLKSSYLGSDLNAQVDLVDKRKQQQLKDQQKIHATVPIQQSPEAKDLSSKQPIEILQPNSKNAVDNSGIQQILLKSCYLDSNLNAQVDVVDGRRQQPKNEQKATVLTQQSPEAKCPPSKQQTKVNGEEEPPSNSDDHSDTDLLVVERAGYTVLRRVHSGPFSRIYLVKNVNNGQEFIAKVESKYENKKTLGLEAKVYKQCGIEHGFPIMYNCYDSGGDRAIILEKLGTDLSRIRRALPGNCLPKADALKASFKTFCRIRTLHDKGWLHRDIKSSNFVVGLPPDDKQIFIVDFGLARPICHRYRPTGICPLVGTCVYQSIGVQSRVECRPKDDLESWFYMCVELFTGTLPWKFIESGWMCDYKRFCRTSGRKLLLAQLPPEFDRILDIIDNSPNSVDYHMIGALIRSAIAQLGQEEADKPFIWKRDPSIIQRALQLEPAI